MLKHLQNLCCGNCAVVYSTHAPELVGIKNKDFNNTFVAKNRADEFKETDIRLYKLKELNPENAEIQDIEPILAKLSFMDINNLADANIKNDKQKWRLITKAISSGFNLSKFADASTILSFFKDVLSGFL